MDNCHCRFCGHPLKHIFADLGMSPLSNEYLSEDNLRCGQTFYPLKVQVCEKCFLVQAEEYQTPEKIFSDYKYFSSYSDSWLRHCQDYVEKIIPRLSLDENSQVLEVACNDGYLLQFFQQRHIPSKGIEPAGTVAAAAREKGLDVEQSFFGFETARELRKRCGSYHLVIGNNVLAHVPDINGFVSGLAEVLHPEGTLTMEFPHLLPLIENTEFDTIYHEHFFYYSLGTVVQIFLAHGLRIYDVEELRTHGGSLRIYATHAANASLPTSGAVAHLLERERKSGFGLIETYAGFQSAMLSIKLEALKLLTELKREGKRIAAFGAAAKGNTFLNYCGIKRDFIDYVVDSNPHKQGCYLPGSLLPIMAPEYLRETKPDYLLILPWNLTHEITEAVGFTRDWGCRFITCIPTVKIF